MNTKTITQIGMREFLRTTKTIKAKVAQGHSFEVLEHATPVFRVVPVTPPARLHEYTLADLTQFQFTGPKDLALTVDKKLYGQ